MSSSSIIVKESGYDVPILLTTFLRITEVQRIMELFTKLKPKTLFITSDGPRTPNEVLITEAVRNIFKDIPWECEVYRLYSDVNIGIHQNWQSAIEYVFTKVDKVICMEDDILPSNNFFYFCKSMLDNQETNERVSLVNGLTLLRENDFESEDIFLSRRPTSPIYGLWKRTYEDAKELKLNIGSYLDSFDPKIIENKYHRRHIINKIRIQKKQTIVSYELLFTLMNYSNNSYCIVSKKNLVKLSGNDIYAMNSPEDSSLLPRKLRTIYDMDAFEGHLDIKLDKFIHSLDYDLKVSLLFADGRPIVVFFRVIEKIFYHLINLKFKSISKKIKRLIVKEDKEKNG